jgi:hypothetical protein
MYGMFNFMIVLSYWLNSNSLSASLQTKQIKTSDTIALTSMLTDQKSENFYHSLLCPVKHQGTYFRLKMNVLCGKGWYIQ